MRAGPLAIGIVLFSIAIPLMVWYIPVAVLLALATTLHDQNGYQTAEAFQASIYLFEGAIFWIIYYLIMGATFYLAFSGKGK